MANCPASRPNAWPGWALEQGVHRFEWMHQRLDGTLFPVEVTSRPSNWLGKPSIYCTWRYITEQNSAAEGAQSQRIEIFPGLSIPALRHRDSRARPMAKILEVNPALRP
jgi:hypothetical protein